MKKETDEGRKNDLKIAYRKWKTEKDKEKMKVW